MDSAFYSIDKFKKDNIRAIDARFEAQKIAFAPLGFQAIRAMLELWILNLIENAGDDGISRAEIAGKTGVSNYGVEVLCEMALAMNVIKFCAANPEKSEITEEKFTLGKIGWFLLNDDLTRANFDFCNYTLFKRRLSQITKMTIQVVHDIMQKTRITDDTKLVFISLRGEIKREFTINKGLIEDASILPAAFSLSVFNTPIACATIAFQLHGGYSAIYPAKANFRDGFIQAVAPVLAGTEKEIILVYADELVPEEYGDLRPKENVPMAFACKITGEKQKNSIEIDDLKEICSSPVEFLRFLEM